VKLDLPAMSCHYQLPIGSKVCSRATTLDFIVELENLFFLAKVSLDSTFLALILFTISAVVRRI
jgi:hypothetical protein